MVPIAEQETIIQFDATDPVVHFFTNMPFVAKKYRKFIGTEDIVVIRDEPDALELEIPKKKFIYKVKKERVISEEQREAARERMRRMRSSEKKHNEND